MLVRVATAARAAGAVALEDAVAAVMAAARAAGASGWRWPRWLWRWRIWRRARRRWRPRRVWRRRQCGASLHAHAQRERTKSFQPRKSGRTKRHRHVAELPEVDILGRGWLRRRLDLQSADLGAGGIQLLRRSSEQQQ